jgi:putative endonuclease
MRAKFTVYILRTSKNTLYTGQTNNLEKRLLKHKSGKGAKYIRSFSGFELVYTENLRTKSEALKREAEIKKWSKTKKEKLVSGGRGGDLGGRTGDNLSRKN